MDSYLCCNYFDMNTLPIIVVTFNNIRPIYISLDFDHLYEYIFCNYCIKYNFDLTFMISYYAPENSST